MLSIRCGPSGKVSKRGTERKERNVRLRVCGGMEEKSKIPVHLSESKLLHILRMSSLHSVAACWYANGRVRG